MANINLTTHTVTATGTVVADSMRIAGFTVISKSGTDDQGFTLKNLASDGSPGDVVMHFDSLSSVGGGASSFTQTYSGNTGIYFKNGIHATVDSHIKLFITTF